MLLTYLHMTGPGDSIPAESVYVSILHQLDAAEFTLCMSTKRRCLAEQSPWHMASGSQLTKVLAGNRQWLQGWAPKLADWQLQAGFHLSYLLHQGL